jgi:predicted phosphoribosyltransferase
VEYSCRTCRRASSLGRRLEGFGIVIPRKLADPDNKEQAIGDMMDDGTTCLDKELTSELSIPDDYIEQEKAFQIQEIKRRSSLYRRQGLEYNKVYDKAAILVQDGLRQVPLS